MGLQKAGLIFWSSPVTERLACRTVFFDYQFITQVIGPRLLHSLCGGFGLTGTSTMRASCIDAVGRPAAAVMLIMGHETMERQLSSSNQHNSLKWGLLF